MPSSTTLTSTRLGTMFVGALGNALGHGVVDQSTPAGALGLGMQVDKHAMSAWGPRYDFEGPSATVVYDVRSDQPTKLGGFYDELGESSGSAHEAALSVREARLAPSSATPQDLLDVRWDRNLNIGRGYYNRQGAWVADSDFGVSNVGPIQSTRFELTNLPQQYASAFGPVRAAYDHIGQGYLAVPVDADGGVAIKSPPQGYSVPSRSALQAEVLAQSMIGAPREIIESGKQVGLALFDAARLVIDGDAVPLSKITEGIRAGHVTWSSAVFGLIESSPAGVIANIGIGTPDSLRSAGSVLGTTLLTAGASLGVAKGVQSTSRWQQQLAEYGLEFPSIPATGPGRYQRGAIVVPTLRASRAEPGIVTNNGDLVAASGRWLDAGTPTPIPLQVAEALSGRSYRRFSEFRGDIWLAVSDIPELSASFSSNALGQMRASTSPFAPRALQINSSDAGMRFNLHHIQPIGLGGEVYNLSNIWITSPRIHYNLHYRDLKL